MADDNSCLFHAVAFLVAEGASPASLRAAIVEQVRADPIMWNEGTLGKPVDEYCAWISDSRRWGGQVELAIFAEKYAVEISVTDVQTGRADVYGSGAGHARRVYMIFTGIHFDGARTAAVAASTLPRATTPSPPSPPSGGPPAASQTNRRSD